MNFNQKYFNQVSKNLHLGNEKVFGCMKVVHLFKTKPITALMLTTEFEFIFLEKVKHDGDLEVVDRFYWDDVSYFELQNDHVFVIESLKPKETSIEIEAHHADKIAIEILGFINKYKDDFQMTKKYDPKIQVRPPTPLKGLQRLRLKIIKEKKNVPQAIISGIESAIRHNNNTLDLQKLKCPISFYPEILPFVKDMSNFSKIVLPTTLDNISFYISKYLFKSDNIKSIVLSGPFNKQIPLIKDKEDHINELVFEKSEISDIEMLKFIAAQIKNTRINSLSLINFCKSDFYNNLFEYITANYITSLSFQDMSNLPIKKIYAKFPNLTSLSFINCDIEITTADINSFPKLNNLTIDKGKFNTGEDLKLTKINTITLSHVEWINSFDFFWNFSGKNPLFSLDVSYAIMQNQQQWNSFFSKCNSIDSNISSINWSGNPITKEFITYLNGNKSFRSIILDNCFTPQNKEQIFTLIKMNTKATAISLCGSDKYHIDSKSLEEFLEELKKKNIEKINLSGQFFGDGGLAKLAEIILVNHSIKEVKYDGNVNASFDGLNRFFSTIGQRGIPIDLEWPFIEIAKLRTKNDVPVVSINKLRQNYKIACNGGKGFEPLTDIEEEPEDYFPEDALNNYAEEFANDQRWEVKLDPIPEPQNDAIIQEAAKNFSVDNLLRELAQSN